MSNAKRQMSAIMALLMFFFAVFPVKRSEAAVPLVGLAIAAYGTGGTLVSANVLTSVGTALIGGTIVALGITPNNAEAPTRVPLSTDQPTIDAVMPPPSVPSTATAQSIQKFGASCPDLSTVTGITFDSPSAACSGGGGDWMSYPGGGGVCYASCGRMDIHSQTISMCPSGYTQGQSGCVVSAPRAVAPDNNYDVQRSPTAGYTAPGPAVEADPAPSYLGSGSGRITVTGTNSAGQPVVTSIEIAPGGSGSRITTNTQSTLGGQSVVNTQTIDVTDAGQVTSVNSSTNQGSLTGVGTGAIPGVQTGASVTPSTPIEFPNDYARSGEAATAAQAVKTSVDAVKDQLTSSVDVADPTVPAWTDPWGVTFNALKGWSLPSHSSSCPQPSFDWEGRVYAFSTHCQLVTDHWSALSAAMMVVWTIAALWFVLTA